MLLIQDATGFMKGTIDVGWRIKCFDGFHDRIWGNTKDPMSLKSLIADIVSQQGPIQIIDLRQDRNECQDCGQVDYGQTGEHPCSTCGLPLIWDAGISVVASENGSYRKQRRGRKMAKRGRRPLWKDFTIADGHEFNALYSYYLSCRGAWKDYQFEFYPGWGGFETNLPYSELRAWFRYALDKPIPDHVSSTVPTWELYQDDGAS